MKYVIHEMTEPNVLSRTEPDGYYVKTINPITLEEIADFNIKTEHDSMDSAISEIHRHKNRLKSKYLTVIPVIKVDYDGNIEEE